MKYRKRVKLMPGVTLNISKSGFSATAGVRGASVNMGRNGAFLNTGIPGTGIYDRKKINLNNTKTKPQRVKSVSRKVVFEAETASPKASYRLTPGNRQSSDLISLTPTEMQPFLEQLKLHVSQRNELKKEYEKLFLEEVKARRLEKLSKWLIYGWFYKGHAEKISEISALRKEVIEDWGNTHFSIDSNICEDTKSEYHLLVDAYEQFVRTHKVWDIISQYPNQDGCYDFERQEIKLEAQTFEGVEREIPPLFFKNTFGTCLYIYQEFILISKSQEILAVAPLDALEISVEIVDFPENNTLPNDSEIVGQTWMHTNKNGEPDRRYKYNPAISICRYALIHFRTQQGMVETFMCSNTQKTKALEEAFERYIGTIKAVLR